MVRVQADAIVVETRTLTAELRRGFLVSLRDRQTGREHLGPVDPTVHSALELVYAAGQGTGFGPAKPVTVGIDSEGGSHD